MSSMRVPGGQMRSSPPRAGTDYAVLAHVIRAVLDEIDSAALAERADGAEDLAAAVARFDSTNWSAST